MLIFDEPQLSGQPPFMKLPLAGSLKVVSQWSRGTQRQFSGKCLFGRRFENQNLPASPRIIEHLQNGIITHFKWIFTLKKATQNFREPFLAEIFEKVSFGPYKFRITRLSARKSEQMKSFQGIKICLCLPFKY